MFHPASQAREASVLAATTSSIEIELVVAPHQPTGAPLPSLGPDSRGNQTGGDAKSEQPTWLLDQSHALTLQDSSFNALRDSQAQRIRTATDRASWENRRATLNPDDDLLVTTGNGWIHQRAPRSNVVPASGNASPALTRVTLGAAASATAAAGVTPATASQHVGTSEPQPPSTRGRRDTQGDQPSRSAPMGTSRPDVDRGPPATLAAEAGRVADNRNADLRAAQLMQALVQSGAAGRDQRVGVGGPTAVGGDPGIGAGAHPGGSSHARGEGGNDDPGGERFIHWYTEQRDRITRALVFPRSRQLSLDQGTTLLRIAVGRDGGLLEPPRVLRTSGFADLDQAALAAVQKATPFSRLPDEIAPNSSRIRLTVPIEFWNPTVH